MRKTPVGYKKENFQNYKKNLQTTYPLLWLYEGFCRVASEIKVPLDEHGRLLTRSRHRYLAELAIELYETRLYGKHGFAGNNGKPISCDSCDHEKRIKLSWADGDKENRNLNLGVELRKKVDSLVISRGGVISKYRKNHPGVSLNTFIQAAILTYVAEIENRPTTFCDCCLMPVGGIQFLYGDSRYNADAYEITPSPVSPVCYIRYKPAKTEKLQTFSIRAHAVPIAGEHGAKIKTLLDKIGKISDDKLEIELEKFGYKLNVFMGEGLVKLRTGQYLAVCPTSEIPKLI